MPNRPDAHARTAAHAARNAEIKRVHAEERLSYQELGIRYGMSRQRIEQIVNGEHLDQPASAPRPPAGPVGRPRTRSKTPVDGIEHGRAGYFTYGCGCDVCFAAYREDYEEGKVNA